MIRVPFCLIFSFDKETPKYKGNKGTTGVPRFRMSGLLGSMLLDSKALGWAWALGGATGKT